MEELARQVNKLTDKTTMTEEPRLAKEEEVEIDPWMQLSQPLPESGYSLNASSNQEQETKNDSNNETTEAENQ